MDNIHRTYSEIASLGKKWFVLLIWALVFLIIMQTIGITIHELGHYTTGKIYGCNDLTISLAKPSIQDSISNVSGWESCETPLVLANDGSRICNLKTEIISFAGLGFALLFAIPILLIANHIIKIKLRKGYLSGRFLALMIIYIVIMAIKSAVFDLFKIGECLFNTQIGEIGFRLINILPNILTWLIVMFFLIDIVKILNFRIKFKQTSKKEKEI